MKRRFGFVSNSSSTSFVCDICGRKEVARDASASEFDFVECDNRHFFCNEELLDGAEHYKNKDDSYYGADQYGEKYCPICQFLASSKPEMERYLKITYGIEENEVFAEIKKMNSRRRVLYTDEYVMYVYKKFNLQEETVLQSLKEKYGTYKKFQEFLNENKGRVSI